MTASVPPEPLATPNEEWSEPVRVLTDRRTIAYGTVSRIESRVAPLLGGTLAAIALAFDRNGSTLDLVAVLAYFVPLRWRLVRVYLPRKGEIVPDAIPYLQEWETHPRRATRKLAYALGKSLDAPDTGLSSAIEEKARTVRRAIWWLFGVTLTIVLIRAFEALALAYAPVPTQIRPLIEPRVTSSAAPIQSSPPVPAASVKP